MNKNDFDENSNTISSQEWENEMSRRISERVNKLENKDSELLAVLEETSRQKKIIRPAEKTEEIHNETIREPAEEKITEHTQIPEKPEELPPLRPLKRVVVTPVQNIPEPAE